MPRNEVNLYFNLFSTCENRINLYAMFIEKGMKSLSPKGLLCFINPNSMLMNDSYRKLRNMLVDDISMIIKLPDTVFLSATVETIIFMVCKSQKNPFVLGTHFKNNDIVDFSNLSFEKFDRDLWKSDLDNRFNIFCSKKVRELLTKIATGTRPLSYFVETSLGITPYDKAKGHDKELITQRKYHSRNKADDTFVPLISGKNIIPYEITDEVEEYLSYGDWLGAPRERRFFTNPRIVVRQIVGGPSLRIIAGYSDDKPTYFTQIGFSLLSKNNDKNELKFLLALLNSRVLSFYHKNKFLDIEKVVFQKVLIANAKQLPVIIATPDQQHQIITLVDTILSKKKQSPQVDTTAEEREIDSLVYALYGLTEDEIKIVEEN